MSLILPPSMLISIGPGNILTVADDLLKNDGQKFLEMMEQLAERRMQREEDAVGGVEDDSEDEEDGSDLDDGEDEEGEDGYVNGRRRKRRGRRGESDVDGEEGGGESEEGGSEDEEDGDGASEEDEDDDDEDDDDDEEEEVRPYSLSAFSRTLLTHFFADHDRRAKNGRRQKDVFHLCCSDV